MKKRMGKSFTVILALLLFSGITNRLSAATIVSPGETDHFAINAPSGVRAGEPFTIELEARDFYDNLITGYSRKDKEVELKTIGTGKFQPAIIGSDDFKNGKAVVTCSYARAEIFKIIVKEKGSAAVGSVMLQSFPGKAAYLEVMLPAQSRAGKPFAGEIIARDVNGNCVTSFGAEKGRIKISSDGEGTVSPDYINPSNFTEGIAEIELTYTKAGKTTLIFKNEGGEVSGKAALEIKPGLVNRFLVTYPAETVAGQAFQAEILAKDAYENLCTDYDKEGKGAFIKTSGTGSIKPEFIPAFSFQNGVAAINFIYTKAEPITIAAQESPESKPTAKEAPKEAAPKAQKPKPETAKPVVAAAPPAVVKPAFDKEKRITELKNQANSQIESAEYEKALETTNEIMKLDPADKDAIRLKERLEQVIRILQ